MLREDIEICLTVATNWDDFRRVLFTMGYEVDYRRFTIKAKDWERGVRVEGLGYTVEGIEKDSTTPITADITLLIGITSFMQGEDIFLLSQ